MTFSAYSSYRLVNTNQYDRKDDRLFKLFADAEYIRPREGALKNAIEKRFVNRTTGSRPGIDNQQQAKLPSVPIPGAEYLMGRWQEECGKEYDMKQGLCLMLGGMAKAKKDLFCFGVFR